MRQKVGPSPGSGIDYSTEDLPILPVLEPSMSDAGGTHDPVLFVVYPLDRYAVTGDRDMPVI